MSAPASSRNDRAALLAPVARWGRQKKRALIAAIERGVITPAEASAAHRLSADELAEWRRQLAGRGLRR